MPLAWDDPLGRQGRGDRGRTGKPSGTDNPFKHMKPDPNNPDGVLFKDPHTGKTKPQPKPEGFDPYWETKHPKPKPKTQDPTPPAATTNSRRIPGRLQGGCRL